MAAPISPRFHRQMARPTSRPTRTWVDKLLLFVTLVAVSAATGWFTYSHFFEYQLPQEVTLTDIHGNTEHVRLLGRNTDMVEYILLADGSHHVGMLSSFDSPSQDLLRHFADTLLITYPLNLVLTRPSGGTVPATVLAHNEDWISYSTQDGINHYAPMSEWIPDDQAVIRHLNNNLTLSFPLNYTFTDNNGKTTPVQIEGRTVDMVKYTVDGAVRYDPIASLSLRDQAVVRALPMNITYEFPIERTLTDDQGNAERVLLQGRTADVLNYTIISSDENHYRLISDYSSEDQSFIRRLPVNTSLSLPLEAVFDSHDGTPVLARVTERIVDFVRYVRLKDNLVFYVPITWFSEPDQRVLRSLPATTRTLTFPLDLTLTNRNGLTLPAHLLGRNTASVTFTIPGDSAPHTYAIADLSDNDQAIILSMNDPNQAKQETQLSELEKKMTTDQATMADPKTSGEVRSSLRSEIDNLRIQITKMKTDLGIDPTKN